MLNECQVILSNLRLSKAREDVDVAEEVLHSGHYKAANNRAYYCIFHCIRAVLALESIDFKSHSQVIGYFNKNYIHAGHFDSLTFEAIAFASKSRNNSDYEDYYVATKEEAESNIANAKLFLEAVESYIARRIKEEYIPADPVEDWDDEEDLER